MSSKEGRDKLDIMTGHKVGQIVLFFMIADAKHTNKRSELAFVSLFKTKWRGNTKVDPTIEMFHVRRIRITCCVLGSHS